MGTLTFTVVETGQTTLTKTYTIADADIDKTVAAYQSAANVSINGLATRAQVLNYWTQTTIAAIKAQVQSAQTIPAVVPAEIVAT